MATKGRNIFTYTDEVTPHVNALSRNIPVALSASVELLLNRANNTMATRVEQAVTKTGLMRVAGVKPPWRIRPTWWLGNGPGRIESGRMIGSITSVVKVSGRTVRGKGGFINAPRYTGIQEEGGGKIQGMGAFSLGRARLQANMRPQVNSDIGIAIMASQKGQSL